MMQYATLEDTVYLYFASNDTSGSGADGATPLYDVREGGAAADAIPVLSGTPTLLTHANYPAGCHEVSVAATAGNGFAANKTYGVFCTIAVSSQNPSGYVGGFRLAPVPANATQLAGVVQSLTDLKDFADDGYDPSTNKVQGVVLVDTLTTYTGNTLQTANVATLITTVGAAGAGLTAIPWNAGWDAEVQSEASDALLAWTIETGITATQQLQLIGAATAGKVSGGPGSPVFKGTDGTTTRITGVADSDGNRTTATYNV